MSWSSSSAYSPTAPRKPAVAAPSCADENAAGPVRTTDQAGDDVVVPLVLWNEPPRVSISCLHVLYLPVSQPSQHASSLMNRWPSLASFVHQWSSQNLTASSASFGNLNSTHSMINLQRVLSRQKIKRGSLTSDERTALINAMSYSMGNGANAGATNAAKSSFMDDEDFQFVDDGDFDGDDELFQLCVFAGTNDGTILFWLLEQDIVVQVNMLIHPSEAVEHADAARSGISRISSPIQSIVSGVDEWGQSNMISITRDGAIARWELPHGACSRADIALGRQLAPIKGMDMFCNNRFAIVYGEQSRMMVLDSWKMTLLYCVDTAQEQVRRSVAIVELKMPAMRSGSTFSRSSPLSTGEGSPTRRVSDFTPEPESTMASYSSFVGSSSSANAQPTGAGTTSPSTFSAAGGFATASNSTNSRSFAGQPQQTNHIWDSLVMSLGSEGLVKCFLWSKPRGGGSSATSILGGGLTAGTFQWVQESCWVISWADDADDITCSQSTSLKDGDNMNPQTALMRSIKSSYFPRALHVSSDASLLLFVWDTKWVVLKRKWICDISPPGMNSQTASGRNASKTKPSKYVGSCRVHPAVFLGRSSEINVDVADSTRTTKQNVWWEDGAFVDENQIALWTNTGHLFQFPVSGNSLSSTGKLFLFKKDQDQLVPRSYHKSVNAIERGQFVAFMDQCDCCSTSRETATSFRTEKLRERIDSVEKASQQGYTTCAIPSSGSGSSSSSSVRLVHMCDKGSLGCWNLSSSKSVSPPRISRGAAQPLHNYERVQFHSLSDGFTPSETSSSPISSSGGQHRVSLTLMMLGRDDSRSSSCTENAVRLKRRRRRHCDVDIVTTSSGSNASSVITNALGPVSSLLPRRTMVSRRASIGASPLHDDPFSQYLMDVPIIAKGYSDGSIEFALLAAKASPRSNNGPENCVSPDRHPGKVTAIAHCCWPSTGQQREAASSPPISRPALSESNSGSDGLYLSARKLKAPKRGVPVEDSCLTSDKNPFYRSRFPPPAQRRSFSSRHLSINGSLTSLTALPPPSSVHSSIKGGLLATQPQVNFMVFSGGDDGSLHIMELTLRPTESSFALDAIILQRFKKHNGAIKDIVMSPMMREGTLCPERYVATIGADNIVNVYAPVYLQNPYGHGPAVSTNQNRSRSGIEWECIVEFCEHPDAICGVEWQIERGLISIECEDGVVYVWSVDTGLLERSIPTALMNEGGNTMSDELQSTPDTSSELSSVDCTKLIMGDSSVHLLTFSVNRSAEIIKANWKGYYFDLVNAESLVLNENAGDSDRPNPVCPGSPYAVGSIELLLLSFLLSWGATPDIDRACRELLGLESPQGLFSCVLADQESGAITIPLPWKSIFCPLSGNAGDLNPFPRKWQHSSTLSANVALAIVSLCMNLMEHKYSKLDNPADSSQSILPPSSPKNKEEFHVLWSQLITQHSVVLPDYVPFFREPSLEFLAKYGFHPCDYTQLAARALLNGSIKRLDPPARSALCAEYSTKLHCEIVRLEMETSGKLNGSSSANGIDPNIVVARLGSLVILLSMIGTCYPGEISPAGAREVCDILVYLLRAPVQHVASVAAELLTKGLMLFRPHLVDLSSLIGQLLVIDMREKQRNPGGDSPTFGSNARVLASGGSNAALSLLVELGACETAFVLALLQQEMNNADRPHSFRECILLYLTELVNTHYLLMFRHLPAVVDTVMCCLDPTKPERRKRCLDLSTRCLHNLVRRFPMVDFHKETQRLALGTMEAVILIYDLRTATKWRVLDGHTSAVSAVSFRIDGQILVSYAAREGSVRWWNSGNAGLFGGMLKMQQSCIKEHKLEVLKGFGNAPSSSGGASGDLKQVIQTCRFQFLVIKDTPGGNQQGGATSADNKERKVLRLTREDASQVQFLM